MRWQSVWMQVHSHYAPFHLFVSKTRCQIERRNIKHHVHNRHLSTITIPFDLAVSPLASDMSRQGTQNARDELVGGARERRRVGDASSPTDQPGGSDYPQTAQERIQQMKAREKEYLTDAVRTSHTTVRTGHETTQELSRQGEAIDRTDKMVDNIEYELKVSDKIIKSMSGFTGLVASWFTRDPKAAKNKKKKTTEAVESDNNSPPRDDPVSGPTVSKASPSVASGRNASSQSASAAARNDDDADTDRLFDELQGNLSVMRDQAVTQQGILRDQHKRLDELTTKMDKTNQHMKTTQRNMKKIT